MLGVAEINRKSFSRSAVCSSYANSHELEPYEDAAVEWAVQHRRIIDLLDLGVGAGRTVEPLRKISKNYVGIDFSSSMVAAARRAHPGVDLRVGDARDLSAFSGESFDFVFFSYNGIDYVDQTGRMAVLAEVRRILRPGGVFSFSSHNRDAEPDSLWRSKAAAWIAARFPLLLAGQLRHFSMRHLEQREAEYEIRNDTAHNYRMMTYYISMDQQKQQLARVGFSVPAVFNIDGRSLGPGDADTGNFLSYVAVKAD
jgi:ubiquinone/menaquinone biosynthesis C-methylase UbiE